MIFLLPQSLAIIIIIISYLASQPLVKPTFLLLPTHENKFWVIWKHEVLIPTFPY